MSAPLEIPVAILAGGLACIGVLLLGSKDEKLEFNFDFGKEDSDLQYSGIMRRKWEGIFNTISRRYQDTNSNTRTTDSTTTRIVLSPWVRKSPVQKSSDERRSPWRPGYSRGHVKEVIRDKERCGFCRESS